MGDTYAGQGRYAQAEALYSQVLAPQRRALGLNHPTTLSTLAAIGRVRLLQRKYPEAEAALRPALTGYEKVMPQRWERYACESMLGAVLAAQKNFPAAELLLLSGYEDMLREQAAVLAPERGELCVAGRRIVQLYSDWGKREEGKRVTLEGCGAPTDLSRR